MARSEEYQKPGEFSTDESGDTHTDSSEDDVKADGVMHMSLSLERVKGQLALEILCGITVALALVPEAVAFALSAGLTPSIGLHSAWIIALTTAILGGRPAMICGATGALAVLVGDTVANKGAEYLFMAVILMGVIQVILGLIGVGSLVVLIPTPVMMGFCNGLALVIGLAQFNNFKDLEFRKHATVEAGTVARRLGAFDAFTNGQPFISGETAVWAGVITAASFFTCLLLPRLTKKVPSALVAIVVGTLIEWFVVRGAFSSSTSLIDDIAALEGSLPTFPWLQNSGYHMPPFSSKTLGDVFSLSITMAVVGLLESMMTLNLVDELTDTKGNTMRECVAQGIANIICGSFGGMGGCAMIGQSMINIGSGARSRISSATAGLCLLLIVMALYPMINVIPVSALVGVMFNVVFHTFEWSSLKLMLIAACPSVWREKAFARKNRNKQKIRRADALVIFVVTVTTVFTDLAVAVGVGMLVATFMFMYDTSKHISANTREEVDGESGAVTKYYDIHGTLFFGSCAQFLTLFDEKNDPKDVRLVFHSGYVADYSAIQALNKLGERYGVYGKTVKLQALKPGCGKLVERSSGLLVNEVEVLVEDEEILPAEREHLNVESFDRKEHLVHVQREHSRDSSILARQGSTSSLASRQRAAISP